MHKGLFRIYTRVYKDVFSKKGQLAILGIHKEPNRESALLLYVALTVTHTFNYI